MNAELANRARLTAIRMVSHRCEQVLAGRGCCLLSNSDWSQPKCPRCTAYLLAQALEALLTGADS